MRNTSRSTLALFTKVAAVPSVVFLYTMKLNLGEKVCKYWHKLLLLSFSDLFCIYLLNAVDIHCGLFSFLFYGVVSEWWVENCSPKLNRFMWFIVGIITGRVTQLLTKIYLLGICLTMCVGDKSVTWRISKECGHCAKCLFHDKCCHTSRQVLIFWSYSNEAGMFPKDVTEAAFRSCTLTLNSCCVFQ